MKNTILDCFKKSLQKITFIKVILCTLLKVEKKNKKTMIYCGLTDQVSISYIAEEMISQSLKAQCVWLCGSMGLSKFGSFVRKSIATNQQ